MTIVSNEIKNRRAYENVKDELSTLLSEDGVSYMLKLNGNYTGFNIYLKPELHQKELLPDIKQMISEKIKKRGYKDAVIEYRSIYVTA